MLGGPIPRRTHEVACGAARNFAQVATKFLAQGLARRTTEDIAHSAANMAACRFPYGLAHFSRELVMLVDKDALLLSTQSRCHDRLTGHGEEASQAHAEGARTL